jgi:hypothetical protein
MRKTILILAAITLFCSFKLTDNKPVVHPYQVVLTLDNWMYVTDYLLKQEQLLQRTSDLPSKVIAANNDTVEMIRGIFFNQLRPQIKYYDSLDAIKKDTTHKK